MSGTFAKSRRTVPKKAPEPDSMVWVIYWRDGRQEALVCSRAPIQLVGLAEQKTFAVQLFPVAGPPFTLTVKDIARLRLRVAA